jgi:hypothetical protein
LAATSAGICQGSEILETANVVWRSSDNFNDWHNYIEIAETKLSSYGLEFDIALEERDGKVPIRLAGTDDIIGVLTIIDDDHMDILFTDRRDKVRLTRTTKEEMEKIHAERDKVEAK